jgi:hypothetical protein
MNKANAFLIAVNRSITPPSNQEENTAQRRQQLPECKPPFRSAQQHQQTLSRPKLKRQ